MVSSLFKLLPLSRHSIRSPVTQNLLFFRLNFLSTSSKSGSESAGKNEDKKKLYTVNYLTTTFGFSLERAHASSKRFNFEKPDKPDSVISFLHNHGFTKAQISNMAQRFPPLLLSDPEKILLPKIEFFKSLGFSKKDVASVVFAVPWILHRSLEKHLIPSVLFMKGLFQSDDDGLLASLKCHDNRILWVDLETTFIPNMEYLKELGVPQSNIMCMLKTKPRTLSQTHDHFRKIVDDVKKMRVNPAKYVFLGAVHVLVSMSKETWEKKMKVYVNWGFSEDEIFEAFRKHPQIMAYSTDKVTDLMNYLVNEMGFKFSIIIKRPPLLGLSLQKRIVPRCSVYRILSEKNLVPNDFKIGYFLEMPEKKFLNKYVLPFEAQAPELLNLYNKYPSCLT